MNNSISLDGIPMSSILRKCAKRIISEEFSLTALTFRAGSTPVQFSSVQFYLDKVNNNAIKNTLRIVSWQGKPEGLKTDLPSHKRISKMKYAEKCIKNTCSDEKLNKD